MSRIDVSRAHHPPIAFGLTTAAGVVHIASAVVHFGEATPLGWSFVGVGWAQLVLGTLLWTQSSFIVRAGAVGVNLLAVGGWALSRTVGLPFLQQEPVSLADSMAVGLELGAILATVFALPRGMPAHAHSLQRRRAVAISAGVGLLALIGSSVAVAELGDGGGDHHADASPSASDDHGTTGPSAGHMAGEAKGGTADGGEAVHQHAGRRLHVHEPGEAHLHRADMVHLHQPIANPTTGADDAPSHSDGHDHAS